ncbi:MAG: hypothetical protein ACRDZO_22460 [Egibacteraceae bacterium]
MPTDPRNYLELEFDAANTAQLARHCITRADIEAVFAGSPQVRRNKGSRSGEYVVIGCGRGGRPLLIVEVRADEPARVLRPVTGWERA